MLIIKCLSVIIISNVAVPVKLLAVDNYYMKAFKYGFSW